EQELLGEDVLADRVPIGTGVGLDPQQLLLVVPLVEGFGLVQPLVALETDEPPVGGGSNGLRQFGLAHTGRSFDEHGLLEGGRQIDDLGDALIGQIPDRAQRRGDGFRGAEVHHAMVGPRETTRNVALFRDRWAFTLDRQCASSSSERAQWGRSSRSGSPPNPTWKWSSSSPTNPWRLTSRTSSTCSWSRATDRRSEERRVGEAWRSRGRPASHRDTQ